MPIKTQKAYFICFLSKIASRSIRHLLNVYQYFLINIIHEIIIDIPKPMIRAHVKLVMFIVPNKKKVMVNSSVVYDLMLSIILYWITSWKAMYME